jgi:hypothetical protein
MKRKGPAFLAKREPLPLYRTFEHYQPMKIETCGVPT